MLVREELFSVLGSLVPACQCLGREKGVEPSGATKRGLRLKLGRYEFEHTEYEYQKLFRTASANLLQLSRARDKDLHRVLQEFVWWKPGPRKIGFSQLPRQSIILQPEATVFLEPQMICNLKPLCNFISDWLHAV